MTAWAGFFPDISFVENLKFILLLKIRFYTLNIIIMNNGDFYQQSKTHAQDGNGRCGPRMHIASGAGVISRIVWMFVFACLFAGVPQRLRAGDTETPWFGTNGIIVSHPTVFPAEPYIELTYYWMYKQSSNSNYMRGTQVWLRVGDTWHALCWIDSYCNDMVYENNKQWGLVRFMKIDESGGNDHLRPATIRIYPSADATKDGMLNAVRVTGVWDNDGGGGSVSTTRADDNSVHAYGDKDCYGSASVSVSNTSVPMNAKYDYTGYKQVSMKMDFDQNNYDVLKCKDGNSENDVNYMVGFNFSDDTGNSATYNLGRSTSASVTSLFSNFNWTMKGLHNIYCRGYVYTTLNVVNGSKVKDKDGDYTKISTETNTINIQLPTNDKETVLMKGCPYPKPVTVVPDQWTPKINIRWTIVNSDRTKCNDGATWTWDVYRTSNGETKKISNGLDYGTTSFDDEYVDYDSKYTYTVCAKRTDWNTANILTDLSNSQEASIVRTYKVSDFAATGESTGIKLSWVYPTAAEAPTFEIWRKASNELEYSEISSVKGVEDKTDTLRFVDNTAQGGGCISYLYQLRTTLMKKAFSYDAPNAVSAINSSSVKQVICSKGTYSGMVKISWTTIQVGTAATKYVVKRRMLGSTNEYDYNSIYSTEGTATSFFYDDNSAGPGDYFEYKVEAYTPCDSSYLINNSKTDNGFCQSTGIISGRVTYGSTSVAVPNAKVMLITSSADNATSQFYSMRSTGFGDDLKWTVDTVKAQMLFSSGKAFSTEMWFRPDRGITQLSQSSVLSVPSLIEAYGFGVLLKPNADGSKYTIAMRTPDGTVTDSKLRVTPDVFTHLTFSTNGKGLWKVRVVSGDSLLTDSVAGKGTVTWSKSSPDIVFGGSGKDSTHTFVGFIDEVRLWTRDLSDADILKYYNHTLSGTETDLKLYWPLDEGITGQQYAYDYSKTGNVPNGNHGKVVNNTVTSNVVPTSDQLSLYGLTDEYGNYVIRGIPFKGEGTNYIVQPMLGIHEFSPRQSTRFVSSSSLNFSSVDFTDVSSFDVSGVIYYKNTNYPLKDAYLYVDGTICAKEGTPVTTDAYGKFQISVPIGDHYITVQKNGHVFCENGRYPADPFKTGKKHTFDQTMSNLIFYDSTLVCVAGRVAGGDLEKAKDLGLGLGKNNIGQAVLQLSAGEYYSMNVVPTTKGTVIVNDFGTSNLEVPSSGNVNSTAYRAGGSDLGATRYIYITTDPVTGEFAAMLPPLEYTLESLQMKTKDGQAHYLSGNFNYTPAGTINATDPLSLTKDSIWRDSLYDRFSYCASLKATYHNDPTFIVRDSMRTDGFFGESSVEFNDSVSATANVDVIKDNKYVFGYPVFVKYNSYYFLISGYEQYTNFDSGTEGITTTVPLDGTEVTVTNQMSSSQAVYITSGKDDKGKDRKAGEFADLTDNTLTLDSLGNAVYKWTAGYPNILSPYTCSLTMTYTYNNAYKSWTLKGNTDNGGLVFGTLPTGNNFVTAGPDQVDMVLRDPPGSASYAYWNEGTTMTTKYVTSVTATSDNTFTAAAETGTSVEAVAGVVSLALIKTTEVNNETTRGVNLNISVGDAYTSNKTTTFTQRMSTSGASGFVGADGDLFIGNSTNLVFGDARQVCLLKNVNTQQYEVGKRDAVTTSFQYSTEFVFTQKYIEKTLIPNLKKLRNALLVPVDQATYDNPTNTTDSLKYITLLKPTDPNYGTSNDDQEVWGDQAVDSKESVGPSYKIVMPDDIATKLSDSTFVDKVRYYNNSISKWIKQLRDNEQAKVDAINKYKGKDGTINYSFDSGTAIERTMAYTVSNDEVLTKTTDVYAIFGKKFGLSSNKTGVICNFSTKTGVKTSDQIALGKSVTRTTGYHLQSGSSDALSVDVYEPLESDKQNSPIFYTRAGQTSCPYEGRQMTKHLSKPQCIGEATMQVEIPKIKVKGGMNVMSNVPTGSKAVYTLQLSNISETGTNSYFNLVSLDKANQTGAVLNLATGDFGNGHTVYVPANDTVNVMLYLAQGTTDVLDYKDIGIVLQSQCQSSIADTVYLSAHFVPSSTDITLNIEKRIMNTSTGDTLAMSIRDFDATYKGLKDILVQCRGEREVKWSTVKRYVINKADSVAGDLMLPDEGIINLNVDMSNSAIYPDQTYIFRAVTETAYGSGYITKTSDEISVVKDMQRPRQFGLANPSDGILSPGDEISVVFNENIKGSALNESTDFIVTGILNGAKVAHSVALKMENTDKAAASTEADIRLAGKSFAVDMWVNCTGAGTLFSHGNSANKFTVGTNATGNLVLGLGGKTFTSKNVVPQNKWVFLTFNYTYGPSSGIFSAMVANDDATITLFSAETVPQYDGVGRVSLGKNMTGAMHEVALWDRARSVSEAQGEMYVTKLPSTPYLIGYWKFDEGEGLLATDYARSRNMKLSTANWYLNNVNKSVTLDGSRYLALDISACSALATDDYAYEMWFKGAKQSGAATLFSTSDNVAMGFDASGNLQLISKGTPTTLSTTNYLDNAWHHVALNVLRNGNAITYVDGTAVGQLAASAVAPLQGSALYVGAESYLDNTGTFMMRNYFTGSVDEMRYWKATLSANVIRANRLKRLTGKEAGLVAYYPLETKTLEAGQVVTNGSNIDAVSDTIKAVASDMLWNYTDEAPALKENITETNVPFTYVTSDNSIVISFDEDNDKTLAAKLEGCTLNFCVRNVRDANDNFSLPIHWSAYVRQNQLLWANDATSLKQKNQTETTFTAVITNQGGTNENWSLSNIPSWLTASETQGTLKPLATKTITFTVSSATPVGKYEETVYLSGNKGISEPYTIDLEVSGDEPSWTVDKSAFEANMNIIGQIKVMDVPSEDTSDKVAAFIDGQCRGVASPVYYPRYDSYYTVMDIYGSASDAGKAITFKIWDASAGIIYPTVNTDNTVGFTADKVTGNMANPFFWNALDQIEQDIALAKGWNWLSFNLTSSDMTVPNILSGVKSATEVVKSKTAFSQPAANDWAGKLTRFYVGDMYKLKTTAATMLTMTGTAVKAANEPLTIQPNWNWIGCNTTYNMTVADAFAGLSFNNGSTNGPTNGDQVKGQAGFALYQDYEWVGTLKSIVPGKGYMYLSQANQPATFTYPSSASTAASLVPAYAPRQAGVFTPVSENAYPGNMTMVAKVMDGSSVVTGAEVGVFASDGCRSDEVSNSDGIVFLTIAGEGTGTKLSFKVYSGGKTTELDQNLVYTDDATYGTMSAPYLIQMDPTAIDETTEKGVNIYPARVVNDVKVDASSAANIKRIMLQDTGGRVLFSRTDGLSEHNVVPMASYADGVYFVVVQTASQGTVVKRVLKIMK
jgi:hypothetical protein